MLVVDARKCAQDVGLAGRIGLGRYDDVSPVGGNLERSVHLHVEDLQKCLIDYQGGAVSVLDESLDHTQSVTTTCIRIKRAGAVRTVQRVALRWRTACSGATVPNQEKSPSWRSHRICSSLLPARELRSRGKRGILHAPVKWYPVRLQTDEIPAWLWELRREPRERRVMPGPDGLCERDLTELDRTPAIDHQVGLILVAIAIEDELDHDVVLEHRPCLRDD